MKILKHISCVCLGAERAITLKMEIPGPMPPLIREMLENPELFEESSDSKDTVLLPPCRLPPSRPSNVRGMRNLLWRRKRTRMMSVPRRDGTEQGTASDEEWDLQVDMAELERVRQEEHSDRWRTVCMHV